MGFDIHMYIEYNYYNNKIDSWHIFGGGLRASRNYNIFAKMANVKNDNNIVPISDPKGLPEKISWKTREDYTLFVGTSISKETALNYLMCGKSKIFDENSITNPDWHSASWLSLDEYSDVINSFQEQAMDVRYIAILEAMKSFKNTGCDVRLVFWFDN